MAQDDKKQDAAAKAAEEEAAAKEAEERNPDHVAVTKDGETLWIHRKGLADHLGLGWTEVDG